MDLGLRKVKSRLTVNFSAGLVLSFELLDTHSDRLGEPASGHPWLA